MKNMVGKVFKKEPIEHMVYKEKFLSILLFIQWLQKCSSNLTTVSIAVIYETMKHFIDYFRIWKSFMNEIKKICLMKIIFYEWRDE